MWQWIEGMKFVVIVWQLCTDGPGIKGQKTDSPNLFMTKAIWSQSFGLILSLISQTRKELQCGFGTVLIAEQDCPLKHALPHKPCHKTRIGFMKQYVFQLTRGKNVFTANWTSLPSRKQNLWEKLSVSERTLPQTPWRIPTWISFKIPQRISTWTPFLLPREM